MGLLGWIKKESLQLRRRESAPPAIEKKIVDPDVTRDEAYLEKLAKFNEWRSSHGPSSHLNFTSNFVSVGDEQWQPIKGDDDVDADSVSDLSSDVELTEQERYKLAHNRSHDTKISPQTKRVLSKKSVDFHRNINKIPQSYGTAEKLAQKESKRFSLPAKMSKTATCLGKEFSFRKKKKQVVQNNNNTIYEDEVEEFEQQHCKGKRNGSSIQFDKSQTDTPPHRFYKENSSPYQHDIFSSSQQPLLLSPPVPQHESNYSTPKRQVNIRRKPDRVRDTVNTSLPKVQYHHPPVSTSQDSGSDSSSTLQSDTGYRTQGNTPVTYSMNDEFIVAVTNEPLVALAPSPLKKTENSSKNQKSKRRRHSPPYQSVINKHGEIVEYALPYSEETTTDDQSEAVVYSQQKPDQKQPPNTPILVHPQKICQNLSLMQELKQLENVVNENFKFLHDRRNDTSTSAMLEDTLEPNQENVDGHEQHSKQRITDLDKSNGSTATTLSRYMSQRNSKNQGDIFLELDSLEKWSKNIQMIDDLCQTPQKLVQHQSDLDFFLKNHSLLICWPSEIRYRMGQLKSAFPSPLDFSLGCFRTAPVVVRKSTLSAEKNIKVAEHAIKRDFEVMSQIKHAGISVLMAIAFDQGVNQFSLVLESFDFTLNYFLHQMDKKMSLIHCVSIAQQIAEATLYLQDCGYVHSNISSHCVLIRKFPYAVKLSCFEMTTDAMSEDIKREIETNFGITSQRSSLRNADYRNLPKYSQLLRNSEKYLKEKYRKLSKQPPYIRTSSGFDTMSKKSEMLPKYMPYHLPYRQKFTLHYYQAPELLAQTKERKFVYPHKNSDVYSLTLLLWEMLNQCVPFVIFNYDELEKLYAMNQAILPIFEEERCKEFRKIFEYGLENSINNRIMSVQNLIGMLEDVKQHLVDAGEVKTVEQSLLEEQQMDEPVTETKRGSSLNDVTKHNQFEKIEKNYFNMQNSPDLTKREENAITNEHLEKLGIFSFTDAEVLKMSGMDVTSTENRSSELEQNIQESFVSSDQTPAIMLDDVARQVQAETGNLIRDLRTPASKLNIRNEVSPNTQPNNNSPLKASGLQLGASLNWSNSTIHQSTLDFNPCKLPKTENQPIYERTSTLKKRRKLENAGRGAIKELFTLSPTDSVTAPNDTTEKYDDLDRELDAIGDDVKYNRDDFLAEIMNELQIRSPGNSIIEPFFVKVKTPVKKSLQKQKQTFLNNLLKDTDKTGSQKSLERRNSKGLKRMIPKQKKRESKDTLSKSIEHLETTPKAQSNAAQKKISKTQVSSGPSSYRFNIGDFTLPDTPIARRNKIRRNAWLSDQQLKVSPVPKMPELVKCVVKEQPTLKVPKVTEITSPTMKETKIQQKIELRHLQPAISSDKKELNVRVKVIHNRKGLDSFTSYKLEPFTVKNDLNSSILGMFKLTDTSATETVLQASPEIRIRVEPKRAEKVETSSAAPPPPTPKSKTGSNSAAVNKTLYHPILVADVNPSRLNRTTSHLDDSNCELRPNMPEMLSEAFKKQKDRSLDRNNVFENNLWKREKNKCDTLKKKLQGDVVEQDESTVNTEPHRKSVRDVIKTIERTFEKTDFDYSPGRLKEMVTECKPVPKEKIQWSDSEGLKSTPLVSKLNVTLATPSTADEEQTKPSKCFQQHNRGSNQSFIQKTIVRESILTDVDTSGMDSTFGSSKKTLTTRVTVNMKKISRRSSDVDMFHRPGKEECVRHSYGGKELMRSLSQHCSRPSQTSGEKESESLVPTGSFGTPIRNQKMVCCNCGSPQIVDLQNLPPGSTFAIPALREVNVTDSFRNSIFDDGGRFSELTIPEASIRKFSSAPFFQIQRTPTTRSTEDLYIDDDFGQDLGANMELFEKNDMNTDDMDFNDFFSTEIFHQQDEQIENPNEREQPSVPQKTNDAVDSTDLILF